MRIKFPLETVTIENEILAIPVGEFSDDFHGVIKLNDVGAVILELLENDISEAEIVDTLGKTYCVTREKLENDVHAFLKLFEEKGILIK